MSRFFVLIVEDQREAARLLRASLEEIAGDILTVREVPSGEEALLELSLRPADVLIVDLGLPGLSGRELISKVHHTHPHTRFLVLTGWDEASARRAVRQLPVHEVLFKPANIADVVAAIRDALGLGAEEEEEGIAETAALPYEESNARLADLLAQGRAQSGADAVLLLDDEGRVLLRSPGHLPAELMEALRRPLVYLHGAGVELARLLGQPWPDNLFFFRGPEREYALASVAPYYLLLWVRARTEDPTENLGQRFQAMQQTIASVRDILARMGILDSARAGSLERARSEISPGEEAPAEVATEDVEEADLEADDQVRALLESLNATLEQAGVDPDAFWQEAARNTDLLHMDADALSYEEARRLGLVPDETSSSEE